MIAKEIKRLNNKGFSKRSSIVLLTLVGLPLETNKGIANQLPEFYISGDSRA
jgi:hypothetical protein